MTENTFYEYRLYNIGLPPLSHIRAFEATVRHRSLTKASGELNISVSSISRHNKLLEEYVGASLFKNSNPREGVTEKGEVLYFGVQHALSVLSEASAQVRNDEYDSNLRIIIPSVLSKHWLLPKLERFTNAHPRTDIQIFHQENISSNQDSSSILSISLTATSDHSEALCSDRIQSLITPKLRDHYKKKKTPIRIISAKNGLSELNCYIDRSKLWRSRERLHLILDTENMAFEAALEGLGVVLSNYSYSRKYMESKLLVPFDTNEDSQLSSLWYTRPVGRRLNQIEQRFVQWLKMDVIGRENGTIIERRMSAL